ncbi:2-amino-4-hydroxy-6-hydroxymethyldihydropteridine diphosphokinase [Corticibacter populi]|uniref:2-amino-4-hydroxy-6-hydroxymethyldihydropteridine pyrophosphokinase n=1 Tax=Corticibacter populi TaxID=1550736 RepID=A0A3M6QLK9_9BURK|nr:2-amino-4-hydroxy-6-hydroxymethyldihydropteridine diphosphokinase [Corticibacter populi]RMX03621.1 2-amino-4-hydroxy-6-hydroxymethyldihydropteridine diphosphokinase [Corticibacter populi]
MHKPDPTEAIEGGIPTWIGLGANLGDARQALEAAARAIARLPDCALEQASPLYRSAPVDAQGPDYLNAVVRVRTRLPALALLDHLQAIELAAGRERPYRNAPRTLDLDILLYGDVHMDMPELTVPHPRMYQRAFVLRPLADIDAQQVPAALLESVAAQALEKLPAAQQWHPLADKS